MNFRTFCSEETNESLISRMSSTRVCMEFRFLSVQIIEGQMCSGTIHL